MKYLQSCLTGWQRAHFEISADGLLLSMITTLTIFFWKQRALRAPILSFCLILQIWSFDANYCLLCSQWWKFFKVPILFISGSDERVNYSTLGVCAPSLSLLTCFPPLPFPVKLPSRSAGIKARELVTSSRHFITFPHSSLLSSVGLYYRLSSLRLIWHVGLSWRTFIGKSKEPGDKNKAHEAGRVDHQAFL